MILSQDSFALCWCNWSSACAYQQHLTMARCHSLAALLLGASTLISHLEMNIGWWSSRLTHLLRWTSGIQLLFAPLLCTDSLLKRMYHCDYCIMYKAVTDTMAYLATRATVSTQWEQRLDVLRVLSMDLVLIGGVFALISTRDILALEDQPRIF